MKRLHEGTIVGIPTVVLYELWYGIKKSARAQANTDALDNFLALDVTPWPFEAEDAEEAGDIRAALERARYADWSLRRVDRRTSAAARCDLGHGEQK